jgi:glycosyltransferase involved in cell wall biosynthesis
MACEAPVVASAVGGIVEVVVDGETGLLVPPARPDDLAREILALLRDPFHALARWA